ncbi:DUF3325 domain-containing protein [Stenotrophomonas maltophilia]|uniref:DUF3325 domain-containing protein n=1 Tax=Stenotrophomonas maltophilia TaxID=40324 RepID=UPI0039C1F9D0
MMLLALTLSFSAFTALSLAMEKHQHDLHGKAAAPPTRRTQWRVLGWVLLAVAFALCVADHGWAIGPVLWLGTMTLGGLALSFGLYPYQPKWIVPLAIALPVLGLVVALL